MEPSVSGIGLQHGFNALLVVLLLIGGAKLITMFVARLEKMEDAHKIERKESRDAHLEALGKITDKVGLVERVHENVLTIKENVISIKQTIDRHRDGA